MVDGAKIAGHPVFELLCLADIDNGAIFIPHNVDTRLHRQLMNLFLERLEDLLIQGNNPFA